MKKVFALIIGISCASVIDARVVEPQDEGPSLLEYAQEDQGRLAFSFSMMGAKIGWMTVQVQLGELDGKPVLVTESEAFMQFVFDGETDRSSEKERIYYSLEGDGPIVRVESLADENGRVRSLTVAREGDVMVVAEVADGEPRVLEQPLSRDTLRNEMLLDAWLDGPPEVGETFESITATWNPELSDDVMVARYLGREQMLWSGVMVDVIHVELSEPGIPPIEAQFLDDGTPLRLLAGGITEIRLEEENVAKNLDLSADMMALTAVPVSAPLGEHDEIVELTLVLEGAGDFVVPSSDRQRVAVEDGQVTLTINRDGVERSDALSAEERSAALESTSSIECDHRDIRGAAAEAAGAAESPRALAAALSQWVDERLADSYTANNDSALGVLRQGKGDCTEHALLFVAMARARGIPARSVTGLVYAGDDEETFAWHEWAEFHDGEHWVAIDPMWNEFPVNATHVRMAEGPDDWGWMVLGEIEFERIDVRVRAP